MPTNRDASPMAESDHGEFSLSEVPLEKRTGFLSITMVLLSFTFFTGTMFAGGKIGVAFDVVSMIQIAVIGNLLLAAYAASLALIAARSGLNAVLMGRFCLGKRAASCPISCSASPNSAGTHGEPRRWRSYWSSCWAGRPP